MNACPFCARPWDQHTDRCEAGVPQVDLHDERGLAGRSISGYQILGGIGKGGMGTVYLALDNIKEGQLDAVKILNRDLVVDRERLRREAVTANRVDHPNVCKIFNYVEAYDPELGTALTLIAMELVRGPTLREVLEERGGVLELSQAALVVKEVGEALTAIHSQDIVHRDIKPTNIIVTRDPGRPERVKIVDFGIAKAVGGGGDQDLTEPGFVAATVHYAPPELLRGKPEKRSDVYALGVVLFELLTGRRPFEATNQAELFSMILDPGVKVPTLDQVSPGKGYPTELQGIMDRVLQRDPEKRFGDPAEFTRALLGIVPQLAETVRIPLADLPPEVPTQVGFGGEGGERIGLRSPPVVWGGIVGGVLALGIVLVFLVKSGLVGGGASHEGDKLTLHPTSAFIGSGENLDLVASLGETSTSTGDLQVLWLSQDPGIVRVDPAGTLLAGRAGATSVLAIFEDDTARAAVQVAPGAPARVTLLPPSLRLVPGGSESLSASVTDAQDNLILDPALEWTSSNPAAAEVDGMGLVRAQTPGTTSVRAQVEGVWNQVDVQVAAGSSTGEGPRPPTCPDPVNDVLDRLELAMDGSSSSRQQIRDGAMACWNREGALTDEEKAYAAWLVGLNTVELEGCSQAAILWLDRAVRLDPGSEAYRVARQACGGDA